MQVIALGAHGQASRHPLLLHAGRYVSQGAGDTLCLLLRMLSAARPYGIRDEDLGPVVLPFPRKGRRIITTKAGCTYSSHGHAIKA